MKTKLLLFFVMLSIAAINSFGQVKDFDISKYKLADYKRQSLDFNFNMLGQSDINREISDYGTLKSSSDEFKSSLFLNYRLTQNNRKNQSEYYASLNLIPYDYYFTNNLYNSYERMSSNSTVQLNISISNYHYLNKNLFYRIGFSTHYYYGNSEISDLNYNSQTPVDDSYTSRYMNTNNILKFGIGSGRIENVSDAQLAVFMLSDLYKNQSIDKIPSDEEILLFTEKITKIRNLRHFDFRLRRIFEIQALDTFLRNSNLVSKSDAIYFTTLNDSWAYSNYYDRFSGMRFSLNFDPNFTFNEYYYSKNTPQTNNYKILGFNVNAECMIAIPASLIWQHIVSGSLEFNRTRNWMSSNSNIGTFNDAIIRIKYELGYYPNSRTYLQFYSVGSLIKRWIDGNNYSSYDLNGNVTLGLQMYYYITDRININLSSNIGYSQYEFSENAFLNTQKNLRPYLNLYFNYALF